MPSFTRKLICAPMVIVLSLSTSAAAVAAEKKIEGFQNFKFGMTETSIRKISKIARRTPEEGTDNSPSGERLYLEKIANVDGVAYEISVKLVKGKLNSIDLSNEESKADGLCGGRFERIFGLIKAKYGNSDSGTNKQIDGGDSVIWSASFTFENGARIIPSTVYLSGSCLTTVHYGAGHGDGAF